MMSQEIATKPPALPRVGLFGAGRVAQALAPALVAAGVPLAFVASRSGGAGAAALAAQVGCPAPPLAEALAAPPPAEVYLLAVADAAVPGLAAAGAWPAGAVVAHTAGSLPLAAVAGPVAARGVRGGVFYPLQTFTPGRLIDWPRVPLFVEAADPAAEARLRALGAALGGPPRTLDSAARLRLHLSAVWASNFVNHLLGIADALLAEADLSRELLRPLLEETVQKALAAEPSPFAAQTGPAVRHDQPTLAAHVAALAAHPAWQRLYEELTASIQAAKG